MVAFHWLPINYPIEFEILLFTSVKAAIHGMAPDYSCKLITLKSSTSYSLRSNQRIMLRFLVPGSSQHLEEEHFVMQPRNSGRIFPLNI